MTNTKDLFFRHIEKLLLSPNGFAEFSVSRQIFFYGESVITIGTKKNKQHKTYFRYNTELLVMKSITFRTTDEFYNQVKEIAKSEDRTASELIRVALKEYIQKVSKKEEVPNE